MMKWQLFLQIDQSFQIHRSYGSMLEGEADELKAQSVISSAIFQLILLQEYQILQCVFHLQVDRSRKIPMLRFRDRDSYASNKTKEYDDIAMKYLSYVLFLLVACFSIYSLMYERHKSCPSCRGRRKGNDALESGMKKIINPN
ncbi:hypothetical protein V6N11_044318 [Hibiscus sabdariffa]|uniref:Uncharacterized protein n=1 Tax=Hibiscus sabdariffa TaxID=183260 RepID=A0ABR2RF74_9ROSI